MRQLMTAIVVCVAMLAVCPTMQTPEALAGDINTLNVAFYHTEVATLDPHVQNSTEKSIVYMTAETLVVRNRDTVEIAPTLATSWKISDDGRVYTFFLRRNVKFHDDTSFNAEAVKFNFDRITALKKGFYWMLAPMQKYEVVDEHTIRFVMRDRYALFLPVMTHFPIVSPKSVLDNEEKKGDYAAKWYIDHAVGTGPYRLAQWQKGVKIVHEKFDGYWGGWNKKHVSRVVTWLIPESGTQRLLLEKGELDLIQNFTVDDFKSYKNHPHIAALEKDAIAPMYIRMNYVAGPTSNRKVREALSYCLDRKLYEQMMGGRIQEPDGPVPKEFLGGWRPANLILEYNPDKAKKLLAEAGYPNGFEMSLLNQAGNPTMRAIAEVWQAGLTKAGVTLKIKTLPWPAIVSRLNNWAIERNPATAENAYIQFIGARLPDAYAYLFLAYHSKAQSGNGRNWMLYSNPKVDEIAEKGVQILNEKERIELYKKAVQIIADDYPDVFVDKMVERVIMRKGVKGFYFDALYPNSIPFADMYKDAP